MSTSPTQRSYKLGRPSSVSAVAAIWSVLGIPGAISQQALSGPASGFLYTANEAENSISAIDFGANRVDTVDLPISPHNVQVSKNGDLIFLVGSPVADLHGHFPSGEAGRLLVFNASDFQRGPLASIEVGEHPAHVVVDDAGAFAYVTLSGENAVGVIDLARNERAKAIPVGEYPHGLRISPDGGQIYVANVEGGSVSVIDTARGEELIRVPVPGAPVQVAFTPDGSRVYVSQRDNDSVAVIDTATTSLREEIPVGDGPVQVHATPDGHFLYVANQGTDAAPGNTVSVIDIPKGEVIRTVEVGVGAHGVAVDAFGRYTFITNINDGTVSVIDTGKQEVVATWTVGAGPNGITYRQ